MTELAQIDLMHDNLTTLRRDIHANPETAFDEHRTAQIVADKLGSLGFEVTTGMGQTGVLLGEFLGMSTATLAMEIEVQADFIRVKRELESGWFQWVKLPLPASISIQSGLNTPRYPSLKGIMGAKKKEIKSISASEYQTGMSLQTITKVFVPQTTKRTEMIEGDPDSAVARIVEILKSDIKVL